MATLNALQVAQLAFNAGWRSADDVATAVAIAERESRFNTMAHNPRPPDNSYGLWQINMIGSLGPIRRAQFGIARNEDLFNPTINAAAARKVYLSSGGSWRPWSTYGGLVVSPAIRAAANQIVSGGGGGALVGGSGGTNVGFFDGAKSALEAMQKLVAMVTNPTTWLRAATFVAGAWLLILGMAELVGVREQIVGTVKAGANAYLGATTGGKVKV